MPEPGQVFLMRSLVIAVLTASQTFVIISTLSLQNLSPKGRMKEKVSSESFRLMNHFSMMKSNDVKKFLASSCGIAIV